MPCASGTPRSAICGKYAWRGPPPLVSATGLAAGVSDSLGDDVLFDYEPDEIGRAAEAKCLKELGFVVLDGPDGDVELGRDLFHALALRQQAQHVALAGVSSFCRFRRGGEIRSTSPL